MIKGVNFEIVDIAFLGGDVPPSSSYGVYTLFVLREYVLMLVNSTTETYCRLLS